jgi:hypothetical protein
MQMDDLRVLGTFKKIVVAIGEFTTLALICLAQLMGVDISIQRVW